MSVFERLADTQAKHETQKFGFVRIAEGEWAEDFASAQLQSRLVKASVTERAVVRRINRLLKKNDDQLKKYRGGPCWSDFGDYYILDLNRNTLLERHVDIESKARELGVLKDHEEIEKRMNT